MTGAFNRAGKLLHEINERHDFDFALRRRCHGGVVGAWLLVDPSGSRAVLKFNDGMAHRIERLPALIEGIRAAAYPTPAWLAAGTTSDGGAYHIVDFAVGEPMSDGPLTTSVVAQLVPVIERQIDLDPDPTQDWSWYARTAAFGEGEDDPRPFLRRIGRPGVDLIEHFDAVLEAYRSLELPRGDMVHGDFNTCNVLGYQGRVSAVIDADACGSGTRAVDYAWLLREA